MTERGQRAHRFFLELQDKITDAIATCDGGIGFKTDEWKRPDGGGGRSRVLENGRVVEKGGVNVSCVFGEMSEGFAKDVPGEGRGFFATGISLIIHPRSPHAPTVHANFRYLEKGDGSCWYGGGSDLTPWILYEDDARHFHRVWKAVCDRHEVLDFARGKQWCDEYFYLPHRGETRGIGGIFFDYLGLKNDARGTPADLDQVERFVQDAGGSFLDSYLPILDRRKHTEGTEDERRWQLIRRGRYVEFNLIYDRGTIFGLKTGGRIESILVSLPSPVMWTYGHEAVEPYQKALVEVLRAPRDWI